MVIFAFHQAVQSLLDLFFTGRRSRDLLCHMANVCTRYEYVRQGQVAIHARIWILKRVEDPGSEGGDGDGVRGPRVL